MSCTVLALAENIAIAGKVMQLALSLKIKTFFESENGENHNNFFFRRILSCNFS